MKKAYILVTFLFLLSLVACSKDIPKQAGPDIALNTSNPAQSESSKDQTPVPSESIKDQAPAQGESSKDQTPETSPENNYEDMIRVSIRDANHMINQFSTYIAEVDNISNQYLTGIVTVYVIDANNDTIANTTLFLNNLAPNDKEGHSILIPISDEFDGAYNIIRLASSKKPTKTPEITDENLYDYAYLTYNDYNDIYGNKKSVGAEINNLTTQYMNCVAVTVTVKDESGNILSEEIEVIKNLKPYATEHISLMFTITDKYTIEYNISGYSFTDAPVP